MLKTIVAWLASSLNPAPAVFKNYHHLMIIKRILIIAPTLLILFLTQSYLWIPTYEEQTRGNPDRLTEYITASSGDASLLNPILSADSASSQIESMVFEGLLDRDKDLVFRGRLATSWEIYEDAFFYVNEFVEISNLGKVKADKIVNLIKKAKTTPNSFSPDLQATLKNIRKITVIPPREFQVSHPGEGAKTESLSFHIKAPARIKLTLSKVDQDLFKKLEELLGNDFFSGFRADKYVKAIPGISQEQLTAAAKKSLPSIEHNPVIIFHLRPDVQFQDGHIFDANDVRFTYQAIMDPGNLSPRVADYEPVKAVEIIDPLTVRIVYKRLYSPALGTWGIGILPEHLLNSETLAKEALRSGTDPKNFSIRQSRFSRHPMGCGPFKFGEWKSDQYIRLNRFEKYWEGPPLYKSYVFRIIPDPLTQEMEFYAGTVDHYNVQPHQAQRLNNDPRFQNFSGTSFGYTYIGYNMRKPPFDDRRVRMAMSMAIDVDKIIKYVLSGQGEVITGPFVKQTDFYNHDIAPIHYDPKGALNLLAAAGWHRDNDGWLKKNGRRLEFTLITNNGNDLRKAILAIVQDAWKKIGVAVRTDLLEWSVFIQERVDKADFDAVILGWSMGIEPDLYQIWHSSQTNSHQLNFVGFKNSRADDLIIKIRQEYDHQKQVEYSHRLHKIIAEEQPYSFLYISKWTAVLDKRIVVKEIDDNRQARYEKISPSKRGDYSYDFNKWVKLPIAPIFNNN
jgi:ABC-type transport system substrate-binding protein